MPNRMSEYMSDRMREWTRDRMSGRMPCKTPDRMPDRMPENMPNGMSVGGCHSDAFRLKKEHRAQWQNKKQAGLQPGVFLSFFILISMVLTA